MLSGANADFNSANSWVVHELNMVDVTHTYDDSHDSSDLLGPIWQTNGALTLKSKIVPGVTNPSADEIGAKLAQSNISNWTDGNSDYLNNSFTVNVYFFEFLHARRSTNGSYDGRALFIADRKVDLWNQNGKMSRNGHFSNLKSVHM